MESMKEHYEAAQLSWERQPDDLKATLDERTYKLAFVAGRQWDQTEREQQLDRIEHKLNTVIMAVSKYTPKGAEKDGAMWQ